MEESSVSNWSYMAGVCSEPECAAMACQDHAAALKEGRAAPQSAPSRGG